MPSLGEGGEGGGGGGGGGKGRGGGEGGRGGRGGEREGRGGRDRYVIPEGGRVEREGRRIIYERDTERKCLAHNYIPGECVG